METKKSSSERREETEAESLVRKDYAEFQQDILNTLESCYLIRSDYSDVQGMTEAFVVTQEAMRSGEAFIARGLLLRDHLKATPPLLKKISQPSELGSYSYIPIEIKNKSSLHHGDRLQMFFYCYLLEPLLGFRPHAAKIILSSGDEEDVFFDAKLENRFFDLLAQTKKVIEAAVVPEPIRCSACSRCLWFPHCSSFWDKNAHISLLSGMGASMAKKLMMSGIHTCKDLAPMEAEKVQEITGTSLDHSLRFVLSARALHLQSPIIIKEPIFEKNFPIYFYDIETYEDRVFCHGLVRLDKAGEKEKSFFCENLDDEEKKWHELLDYFATQEKSVVYCWTMYEKTFIASLWQKYGGSEQGYERLSQNLKDQCAFVRNHFVLPCRGYSIKVVAPYFNFSWKSKNANGMNCIAWYRMWLEEGDIAIRDKIIEYNLDDVRAMVHIDKKLKKWVSENDPKTSDSSSK